MARKTLFLSLLVIKTQLLVVAIIAHVNFIDLEITLVGRWNVKMTTSRAEIDTLKLGVKNKYSIF